MFDLDAIVQPQITVTSSGYGPTQDTGSSTLGPIPSIGKAVSIIINGVIGDPNVWFRIQTSKDGVTWGDVAFDEEGPVNVVCQRGIKFFHRFRYWRLAWGFAETDPGEGSGNSSSLSGQSFNSSSSGGSQSLSFIAGLTPTRLG